MTAVSETVISGLSESAVVISDITVVATSKGVVANSDGVVICEAIIVCSVVIMRLSDDTIGESWVIIVVMLSDVNKFDSEVCCCKAIDVSWLSDVNEFDMLFGSEVKLGEFVAAIPM